ncbi:MAG TPA: TldD/PmbA family protein [Fibrobacteria bacterium]|nr:TldD/PmbA family protein [Fibrobacteria bacterium]
MTSSLSPHDAVSFLFDAARKKGAAKFDAVAGESEAFGLELFEGKVKSTEISNSRGIGIRLFRDSAEGQRPGFAFTERMTPEALSRTVDDAWSHAALTDPVEIDLPAPAKLPDLDLKVYNPALEDISLEEMKSLGLEMEALAKQGDARIENVPYLGVSRGGGFSLIANSNGVLYESKANSVSAWVGAVAKKPGDEDVRKMGVYSRGGRTFDSSLFDATRMARIAVERATELLDAEPVPSGEYPIVFSHRTSGQIFGMFGSPFFAEAAQKGQSRLKDKLGEQIASPLFTLVSDPFLPDFPGSHLFDGEGVPAQRLEVVTNGVLNTFLYNLESAKKAGVKPTGTGSRGYSGKAGTGFANYIVPLGGDSLESLLSRHPKCLLIVKLEGGSGCSAISGEISIGAQGFLYENGQRIRAVDRITLSTNFLDLLKNVSGLSNEYSDAFSSMKVPDVLVEKVNVAG